MNKEKKREQKKNKKEGKKGNLRKEKFHFVSFVETNLFFSVFLFFCLFFYQGNKPESEEYLSSLVGDPSEGLCLQKVNQK